MKSKFLRPPWLELILMLAVLLLSYIALSVISIASQTQAEGMHPGTITLWMLAFFLISFAIGILSVIAGIGGGILFTPLMMAFTPVNSVVIRATGLIVSMFSGLMSTGFFLKKGLGNFRLCLVLMVSQGVGALLGAQAAIAAADEFGDTGEGVIRILLGILLAAVIIYFLHGGKKLEHPNIQHIGSITKWMKLDHSYLEESEGKVYSYKVRRIVLGLVFLLGIGFLGGFYGMGAGWAITPVQNLLLGVPMKVATANSGIILGMGATVSVWPYILAGAIIPLFVLPWLAGQVLGGFLGSMLFVKVKVKVIRFILIGIMAFTCFSLIADGLFRLYIMPAVPGLISLTVFFVIMAIDILFILRLNKNNMEVKQ